MNAHSVRPNPYLSFRLRRLTAIAALCFAAPLSAQTVTTVANFTDANATQYPTGAPAQGRDGKLYGPAYGTTYGGFFSVTTAGTINQIYALDGTSTTNPFLGLTLSSDGNFYGTSTSGAGNAKGGTLFKVTPGGAFALLNEFTDNSDYEQPEWPPILASDGALYGTTLYTVYEYAPSGAFSTLDIFDSGQIAGIGMLVQGSNGSLYGTGEGGGGQNCGGAVQMALTGTLLKDFTFNCKSPGVPGGPLTQANDGNYYSMTQIGGTFNYGTIFKLTPNGTVSVVHTFQGAPNDGVGFTLAGLALGTDGDLYGVTGQGGANGTGIIFQVSTSGAYKVLYSFAASIQTPFALVQHTNGKFYGFTSEGGTSGYGTMFSLDMGLGPFITFVNHFGRAGQSAQILGQGFKGTTSVTFNGVPATSFKVASDTFLTAVVPSGATTGKVVVTTPGGTLTSNVNFRITN